MVLKHSLQTIISNYLLIVQTSHLISYKLKSFLKEPCWGWIGNFCFNFPILLLVLICSCFLISFFRMFQLSCRTLVLISKYLYIVLILLHKVFSVEPSQCHLNETLTNKLFGLVTVWCKWYCCTSLHRCTLWQILLSHNILHRKIKIMRSKNSHKVDSFFLQTAITECFQLPALRSIHHF